jgi:hypothetical protein
MSRDFVAPAPLALEPEIRIALNQIFLAGNTENRTKQGSIRLQIRKAAARRA